MNYILINEPRSKYSKSKVIFDVQVSRQCMTLITNRRLKLVSGERVKVNVALPHSGLVFTDDFLLYETHYEAVDLKNNSCIYQFMRYMGYGQPMYTLPKAKISGLVVFSHD